MDEVVSIYIMHGVMAQQNNFDSFLKSNIQFIKTYKIFLSQGFWYFARSRSHEIQVNPRNPAKFGSNLIKYMPVQHIWNLFQLLGLFTCRKLAKLSWNFVTETCKQRPETTRPRLCCEKLGTSHNLKGFVIGSLLERIVVERANDDLC